MAYSFAVVDQAMQAHAGPYQGLGPKLQLRIVGLHRHHDAEGVAARHGGEQGGDALVVPDPRALEVGQLDMARPGLIDEVAELDRVRLEEHAVASPL